MLSKNNSNPAVCVNNLIQIARGEVPYDRVKGISSKHIDVPSPQAVDELIDDVEWMLDIYEPRVDVENIEVTPVDAPSGHFAVKATINDNKEADDE